VVAHARLERRADSLNQLRALLESRTETLVLFSQLAGFRPFQFQPKIDVQHLLQEFCESLVDYTASAHFQLYRFLDEGTERRGQMRVVAEEAYPRINACTEQILNFNDKYESEAHDKDLLSLDSDLSAVGEVLAERIQQEDKLISVLAETQFR